MVICAFLISLVCFCLLGAAINADLNGIWFPTALFSILGGLTFLIVGVMLASSNQ